ncbi:hypothetical protein HDV01_000293 [Terramyces sp. JEL0728]|nr:hypothetical protein HDV01_000293 [Terramyces sp. JEL0728]
MLSIFTLLVSVWCQSCSSTQKCPNGLNCSFPQGLLIGVCISPNSIPSSLPSIPQIPGANGPSTSAAPASAPTTTAAPPVVTVPGGINSIPIALSASTTPPATTGLHIPTGNSAGKAVAGLGFTLLMAMLI